MKLKITRENYNRVKANFDANVTGGFVPGIKEQGRSKKRREFYRDWAFALNCYEGTVRRVVKSKNYADYLRTGRENRGNSTKRREPKYTWTSTGTQQYVYLPPIEQEIPKPKKYKTTIISRTRPDQLINELNLSGLESYTVEVLND